MSHRFPNPGTGESLSGIFHSVEARVSARIVAPSALAFLNSQLFSDVRSFYFIGYFYFESLFCFWFFVFRFGAVEPFLIKPRLWRSIVMCSESEEHRSSDKCGNVAERICAECQCLFFD